MLKMFFCLLILLLSLFIVLRKYKKFSILVEKYYLVGNWFVGCARSLHYRLLGCMLSNVLGVYLSVEIDHIKLTTPANHLIVKFCGTGHSMHR